MEQKTSVSWKWEARWYQTSLTSIGTHRDDWLTLGFPSSLNFAQNQSSSIRHKSSSRIFRKHKLRNPLTRPLLIAVKQPPTIAARNGELLVFVPGGILPAVFTDEAAWSPGERGSVGGREAIGGDRSGGNMIEAPFRAVLQIILWCLIY